MVIVIFVLLIVLLGAAPLVLVPDSEFGGSDGVGSEVVARIAPEYNAQWATNWWTPPGSETESMLFALQATAGGILIGYCFGYMRGKKAP
ncbi:MAG: cobalt transport protein CbiN [Caldilineaceae bacterium]|nr:cobalt transport protein CbiN [Caldilineaceae bacterium]